MGTLADAFELCAEDELLSGRRSHLVEVVHEVHFMGAAVSGTSRPVVDHVVEDVECSGIEPVAVESAAHAPVASCTVGEEVMVEGADVAADGGCIAVSLAFLVVLVPGDVECFGDEGVLQGDVLRAA